MQGAIGYGIDDRSERDIELAIFVRRCVAASKLLLRISFSQIDANENRSMNQCGTKTSTANIG